MDEYLERLVRIEEHSKSTKDTVDRIESAIVPLTEKVNTHSIEIAKNKRDQHWLLLVVAIVAAGAHSASDAVKDFFLSK